MLYLIMCPSHVWWLFVLQVADLASVAALARTILTWCTRMSATGECAPSAVAPAPPRTAAAMVATATRGAAGRASAPPPPAGSAGTEDALWALGPAHTASTRITATAVSTVAPGSVLELQGAEGGRPLLLHILPVLSPWWPSSSTFPSPWWAWWDTLCSSSLPPQAGSDAIAQHNSAVSITIREKMQIWFPRHV